MSADSELLIKIKTILESQGIDAAKTKINDLISTTNASAVSEAAANRERDKTTDKAEKTARAILAMNGAMEGGMGPFRAAVHVANQLGGSFSMLAFKASAIGAAITIGWNVGAKLREWVTGAKDAEAELEKLKEVSKELGDRIAKLATIRLTELKKEADDIAKGFSTAADKAERLKRLSDLREDAQLANDLAGVDLRFKKGEINANERDRLEIQFTHDSQMRKNQGEEKRILSSEQVSYSTENQARRKYGQLSRKAGLAQQEYDQSVQAVKDGGIDDPESMIAEGFDSPKFKSVLDDARARLKYATSQQKANRENILVNQDLQGPIDAQRVSDAQKKMDSLTKLRELPGLKTVRDMAKQESAEYKPKHDDIIATESSKREQLEADKDVLVSKYDQTQKIQRSGLLGIQNKINSDFDQAVTDSAAPADKARSKGKELLDSLHLNFRTIRNNAGDPLSTSGQSAYDSSRSQQATEMVNSAMIQAYKGRDSSELTSALVSALRTKAGAELILSKDQVKEILDAIQSIGKQSADAAEAVKNLKSQSQSAPGLND